MKKNKLPLLPSLQKKCDNKLQELGRKEFKKCEVCGKKMNCLHHFFPKSVSARLRYEWDNMIPICTSCHFQHHTSFNPKIHAKILKKKGFEWYDKLENLSKKKIKPNRVYYNKILLDLTKQIDE